VSTGSQCLSKSGITIGNTAAQCGPMTKLCCRADEGLCNKWIPLPVSGIGIAIAFLQLRQKHLLGKSLFQRSNPMQTVSRSRSAVKHHPNKWPAFTILTLPTTMRVSRSFSFSPIYWESHGESWVRLSKSDGGTVLARRRTRKRKSSSALPLESRFQAGASPIQPNTGDSRYAGPCVQSWPVATKK
jgi:hypothetical protein